MKHYFKSTLIIFMVSLICFSPLSQADALPPSPGIEEIIKAGVKKVIKAMDLRIQRLQNKTIWLQNLQKTLENGLSKLKLTEIADWSAKQELLFKNYYEELTKVKSVIRYYQLIKQIVLMQKSMLQEYQRAWNLLKKDKHFVPAELNYMQKVYSGILKESVKNIDLINLVLGSLQTQTSDAKRLEMINNTADDVAQLYDDLKKFNQQNILLTLQRAKSENEVDFLRKVYGLNDVATSRN